MSVQSGSGIRNGIFTAVGVRPQGYQYPIGLTPIITTFTAAVNGTSSIDGTNTVFTFTLS